MLERVWGDIQHRMKVCRVTEGANIESLNFHTSFFFHSRTAHLDIIKDVLSPTDAHENCFKRNIKIYIKTAPVITPRNVGSVLM